MKNKPFFLCTLALTTLFVGIPTKAMDKKLILFGGSALLTQLFFKTQSHQKNNHEVENLIETIKFAAIKNISEKSKNQGIKKFGTLLTQAYGNDKTLPLFERLKQLESEIEILKKYQLPMRLNQIEKQIKTNKKQTKENQKFFLDQNTQFMNCLRLATERSIKSQLFCEEFGKEHSNLIPKLFDLLNNLSDRVKNLETLAKIKKKAHGGKK